jgi:hypothetical protein
MVPEVLATKQELAELLAGRSPARVATTWRSAVLGELSSADS